MTDIDRSAAPAADVPPLELPLDETLERLGGDRDLFATLADLHRSESLAALDTMRGLLDRGDVAGLGQVAHRLAGSLLVFGAVTAVTAARQVEHLASAGQANLRQHLATLELELHRVNAALDRALRT